MNSSKKNNENNDEKKIFNNSYLKRVRLSNGPIVTVYQSKKGLSYDIRHFSTNEKSGVEYPTQRGIRLNEQDMESLLEIKEEFSLPRDDECQRENVGLELTEEEEDLDNKINPKQKIDQSFLAKKKNIKK
jgi:hypothetical protein